MGLTRMKKICAGLSLGAVALLLAAATPNAQATGLGNAIGHAVIHKVVGGHNLQFANPLDAHKLMVIIPEPNSGMLTALGGLVGLVTWRLRRRPSK
jgi:MYXO-CTERM domain-containing protein